MPRRPPHENRVVMPAPQDAAAPGSAILRVPGLGGLRLLHSTRSDRAKPVAARVEHHHQLWHCVAYAAAGGACRLDGREIAIHGPTLVLTSPGQPHAFSRLAGEEAVYHEVTFCPERPGAAPSWSELLSAWTGTACTVPDHVAVDAACAEDVSAVAGRMAAIIAGAHPHSAALLQLALADLLGALFRHLVADAERQAPPDPVERARRFIEHHAEDPIDLAAVANAAGLSAKHLGRVFAARFGTPPMHFRRSVLMQRAAVLLRTGDASIEAIATQLGFSDWRYFSRCFRAEHGQPPARYRAG